jgi:membrane protein YdbS with pleckstrin-like domain
MYERLKSTLLWLLKVPPEPHDPMGDVHSLRVFRAAPGYLHYITIGWLITQLAILVSGSLILVPLLVASSASRIASIVVSLLAVLAALIFLAQAALSFFSLRLNYEMRWYKVTDRSLRIRAGVWNVHEMTMTFANVQNITVSQGPLERLFGISDVKVDTAGGGGGGSGSHAKAEGPNLHVATFRGVDNPEEIRDLMLQRLRRLRDAGLGDLDDAPAVKGDAAYAPSLGAGETLTLLAAFRDEARALRTRVEAASPPSN